MHRDGLRKSIVLALLFIGSSIPMVAPVGAVPVEFGNGHAIKADTVTIGVKGAQLEYETTAIEAEAGTELTIRLENEGTLPHNVVLQETDGPEAHYELTGEELYVRAKIISLKAHSNPFAEGDTEVAWTQPVRPEQWMTSFVQSTFFPIDSA